MFTTTNNGGDYMNGADVKKYILSENVKLWKVARILGINDGNFSRRLRKDFSDNEFNEIKEAVKTAKANTTK